MRLGVAILLILAGCAEDQHKLESGSYAKATTSIEKDDCNVAQPLGQVDMNYGRLTVTDIQVTHTTQFMNEIYKRMGNALDRPQEAHDLPATGSCVLTDTLGETGSLTADDVLEITRHESHAIKSGDCTNVLRSMCASTFTYKLTRIGP